MKFDEMELEKQIVPYVHMCVFAQTHIETKEADDDYDDAKR